MIVNPKIPGAALTGKVVDRQNDCVKVQLDIDKEGQTCWLQYATPYSAEEHSGWHCMPEKGDRVLVQFPENRTGIPWVIGSLPKEGSNNSKIADPAVKIFGNTHGKEMILDDRQLKLTAKEQKSGKIFVRLDGESGVELQSDQLIQFISKKNLSLNAPEITATAKDGIYLLCGQSSIILDGTADIQGSRIDIVGAMKTPVSMADNLKKEEVKQEKKGSIWNNILDGLQIGLDIVGLIPAAGEVADLANAGISALRSNYVSAGLSLAACIPFAGWAATGAKVVKRGVKIAEEVQKTAKAAKKGKAVTKARKVKSNIDTTEELAKVKKEMKGKAGAGKPKSKPKKEKYHRSKSERRKALKRDANDPNSGLDQNARDFVNKTDGKNVPEGYEVAHEKPLYTVKTIEAKKELDTSHNMRTLTKKEHRANHKPCGITFHDHPC